MAETIAGLREVKSGTIKIEGVDVTNALPKKIRQAGLAYVPEERMREGAIAGFTVWENLLLIDYASPDYLKRGLFDFTSDQGSLQRTRRILRRAHTVDRDVVRQPVRWQHPEAHHGE